MRKKRTVLLVVLIMTLTLMVVVAAYLLFGPITTHPVVQAGWAWMPQIYTWWDENENGVWDIGERPLQDVQISISYDQEGQSRRGTLEQSNWKGKVDIFYGAFAECPSVTIEISANIPEGYKPTTRSRRTVRIINTGNGHCINIGDRNTFSFGFTDVAGYPTATPFPPSPVCTAKIVSESRVQIVRDIVIAPDGVVWFVTWGGVAYLDPSKNAPEIHWVERQRNQVFTSIAISPDNVVWTGTNEGARRFDGTWTTYTTQDGLASNVISDLAIASDGTVWCITDDQRVSYFSPDIERWTIMAGVEFDCRIGGSCIVPAPDNSVWFGAYPGIFQAIPITESNGISVTTTYKLLGPLGLPDLHYPIEDMVFIDNRLWTVGADGFGFFDSQAKEWQLINKDHTFTTLAQASDGSFWLGTQSDGIRHFTSTEDDPSYFYRDDGILDHGVFKLVFAPDGTLWAVDGPRHGGDAVQCVIQDE